MRERESSFSLLICLELESHKRQTRKACACVWVPEGPTEAKIAIVSVGGPSLELQRG